MLLEGEALTERQGSMLEADTITYQRNSCLLDAHGDPHLFDSDQVLVGEGIRYDTCRRRGIVEDALTNFTEGSTVWFLRGNVAQDSSSSRIYAGSSEITSCDLPTPHYHFSAGEMKWISRNVLVARPVVLYVRDVPILWLPFIFQDVRPGRRSGILVPQFGLNDLVRPTRTYNRQITNVGYYWAPNDYMDLTAGSTGSPTATCSTASRASIAGSTDSSTGSAAFNEQRQVDGASALTLRWDHRQEFNLSTSLNFSLNYASNNAVVRQNAIDPLQNTQQITSSLNYSKRFGWGTVTLGGNRRQSITDGSVQQLFPALTLSPVPIALGSDITWSPGLSFTNNTTSNDPLPALTRILPGGVVDTVSRTADTRVTAFNFDTPIRFGSFNWSNSVAGDRTRPSTAPDSTGVRVPDPSTPDPNDSVSVSQLANGSFQSSIDWDTGINLPVLFRGSWKLQPVLGIANSTTRPLRDPEPGDRTATSSTRASASGSAPPPRRPSSRFFPGIGPLARIRHSLSPVITWNYQPAADIPLEFAQAIAQNGQPVELRSDATRLVSRLAVPDLRGQAQAAAGRHRLGDRREDPAAQHQHQSHDLRLRAGQEAGPDRLGDAVGHQFGAERSAAGIQPESHARPLPRRGGKRHRQVRSVPSERERELRHLRRHVPGDRLDLRAGRQEAAAGNEGRSADLLRGAVGPAAPARVGFFSTTQAPLGRPGRTFSANFNYSLARTRPIRGRHDADIRDRQSLGFSTNFSPTPFWSLSWSSQYNITDGEFESQVVRLERDLHEWRASFNFVRNPNGNFAFYFSIYLTRPAGAQVRLRPDDIRELVSSRRDDRLRTDISVSYRCSNDLSIQPRLARPLLLRRATLSGEHRMRGWWIPAALLVAAACSDDDGRHRARTTPETPESLTSVSLDGAIALTWSDNAYLADPGNFQNYRVYSTTYDIDATPPACGNSFRLEGTTVAPEFVVGALANGVPRCYAVTAVSVDGFESDRSPLRGDTPRPDARNVADLRAADPDRRQRLPVLGRPERRRRRCRDAELGLVRDGTSGGIDFAVDRDGSGDLFLTPIRAGTGVEYYDDTAPVEDLTSVDFAPDQTVSHHSHPGRPRLRLRLRDERRRRLPALRRGSGDACGPDVPHHGLGLPDRSG